VSEYPPVKAEITAAIELLRSHGYEVTLPEPTTAGMVTFDDYESPPPLVIQISDLGNRLSDSNNRISDLERVMLQVINRTELSITPGSPVDRVVDRAEAKNSE